MVVTGARVDGSPGPRECLLSEIQVAFCAGDLRIEARTESGRSSAEEGGEQEGYQSSKVDPGNMQESEQSGRESATTDPSSPQEQHQGVTVQQSSETPCHAKQAVWDLVKPCFFESVRWAIAVRVKPAAHRTKVRLSRVFQNLAENVLAIPLLVSDSDDPSEKDSRGPRPEAAEESYDSSVEIFDWGEMLARWFPESTRLRNQRVYFHDDCIQIPGHRPALHQSTEL